MNPIKLNIGIEKVISIKQGRIIIETDSKESLSQLREATFEKLSLNYDIQEEKLKSLSFVLTGLRENYNEVELNHQIKEANKK